MTLMQAEIAEIPDAVEALFNGSGAAIHEAGAMLRRLDPPFVATLARGSSDHAAGCFKTACELRAGVPVASIGPSVASVYGVMLKLRGAAALALSQSGRSPDLVAALAAARQGGAATIAIINAPDSPLAAAADLCIPVRAGVERSVAATKSFVGSAVAALALLAAWQDDAPLWDALRTLPPLLHEATRTDWSPAQQPLVAAQSLFLLGRGPGFPMALEGALKFKETCGLHAEAFSSAEVQHGPMALVRDGFPVLAFLQDDAALPGLRATIARLAAQGGTIFAAGGDAEGATRLPLPAAAHPLVQPLIAITAFYGFVERLARERGRDPDRPQHLRKVTETL